MSDLETRLTEVLRAEAEAAPDALGLADAARCRARARRRTTIGAAGALALAALVVPVAIVALGGDGESDKAPVAENTDAADPEVVQDGRWETWHGVTVQVPEDWEYGDQSAWCAGGGSVETFRITRPGGVVPAIGCTPAFSFGLSFQEVGMGETEEPFDWPVVTQTGDTWPPGTFVGGHGENGVLVTVAGPDHDTVADVLATVRAVTENVDPHGCSVTDDGGPGMAMDGDVPVCRYDEQGDLVQSERLSGADAAAAVEAVRAAKLTTGGRTCQNGPTEYVVMGVEGDRVEVQYAGNSICVDRGVFIEGLRHEMTADVLYWALSPGWSGSVDGDVPLPDELRR